MGTNGNIGKRIGRYELVEEIGRGGMAIVYRAKDESLQRDVALKLLHPHLSSHLESRKRFRTEAQAVAKLKHPALIEVYDYSDDSDDDICIVMELIEGTTLRHFLEDRKLRPLSAEATALVLREVCDALEHAHANGIVHRDVKPENILIGPRGTVKLSDFGIAHLAGLSQLTATGQILGSPAYMSPEHIEHVELDFRADLFSFGSVIYELAVGRAPFAGRNPAVVIKKIVEGEYTDPLAANPAMGHHLATIIRRCLQSAPKQRYASAKNLLADLDGVLAVMNIEKTSAQLEEYFDAPEDWDERRRRKIIEKTLQLGTTARRNGRSAEAFDHFNRVLAMEPGNERALSAVTGLSRTKQVRLLLERAAIILPLIIAVVAIGWSLTRDKEVDPIALTTTGQTSDSGTMADSDPSTEGGAEGEPDTLLSSSPKFGSPPVITSEPGTQQEMEPDTESDTGNVTNSPPGPDQGLKKPPVRHTTHRVAATRKVVFTPYPMAVAIVIDKKDRFIYGLKNRSRTVPVGEHSFRFEPTDPKRFEARTWKVKVPKGDSPFPFRKRLDWKPAKIIIKSNVDTVVTVPGKTTGRTNKPFSVRIVNGPEEQAVIVVSAEGYTTRTQRMSISAGETTKVTVNLSKPKEPDREIVVEESP